MTNKGDHLNLKNVITQNEAEAEDFYEAKNENLLVFTYFRHQVYILGFILNIL